MFKWNDVPYLLHVPDAQLQDLAHHLLTELSNVLVVRLHTTHIHFDDVNITILFLLNEVSQSFDVRQGLAEPRGDGPEVLVLQAFGAGMDQVLVVIRQERGRLLHVRQVQGFFQSQQHELERSFTGLDRKLSFLNLGLFLHVLDFLKWFLRSSRYDGRLFRFRSVEKKHGVVLEVDLVATLTLGIVLVNERGDIVVNDSESLSILCNQETFCVRRKQFLSVTDVLLNLLHDFDYAVPILEDRRGLV